MVGNTGWTFKLKSCSIHFYLSEFTCHFHWGDLENARCDENSVEWSKEQKSPKVNRESSSLEIPVAVERNLIVLSSRYCNVFTLELVMTVGLDPLSDFLIDTQIFYLLLNLCPEATLLNSRIDHVPVKICCMGVFWFLFLVDTAVCSEHLKMSNVVLI